jgi:hypothetical protein
MSNRLLPYVFLMFFIGLFIGMSVQAAEVRLGITMPTENTDGSPIPASGPSALNRSSIGWWLCSESDAVADVNWTNFPPSQETATIEYPDDPGTYCFRAGVRNNGDSDAEPPIEAQWSERSNTVQRTIVVIPPPTPAPGEPAVPGPPTIIIITQ